MIVLASEVAKNKYSGHGHHWIKLLILWRLGQANKLISCSKNIKVYFHSFFNPVQKCIIQSQKLQTFTT